MFTHVTGPLKLQPNGLGRDEGTTALASVAANKNTKTEKLSNKTNDLQKNTQVTIQNLTSPPVKSENFVTFLFGGVREGLVEPKASANPSLRLRGRPRMGVGICQRPEHPPPSATPTDLTQKEGQSHPKWWRGGHPGLRPKQSPKTIVYFDQ